MAMNAFMHPRNLYKTKPDFSKLGEINEDFRTFLIPVTMPTLFDNDLKNKHAERLLMYNKVLTNSNFRVNPVERQ